MYFTNTPALNSMEAIMKKLPYGTQKGEGRFRRLYQYTKKDCDCRLCLYYRKKNGCALALCPVLDIRLGCGAATIGDAVKAVFKDAQNTAFQKRLSQIYHRKDDAEMIFQNNRNKQIFEAERLSMRKPGKKTLAVLYLLTADHMTTLSSVQSRFPQTEKNISKKLLTISTVIYRSSLRGSISHLKINYIQSRKFLVLLVMKTVGKSCCTCRIPHLPPHLFRWIFLIRLYFPKKKKAPTLPEVYHKAIANIPLLNLASTRDDVSFGAHAFLDWADALENGKFDNVPVEDLDLWPHYSAYLCIIASNVSFPHFLNRAKKLCPDIKELPAIDAIMEKMHAHIGEFCNIEGGFGMEEYKLKDRELMRPVCEMIRKYAGFYNELLAAFN